jgi:hypothetical protein
LEPNRDASAVDTRIKTYIGGWLALLPMVLIFPYGFGNIFWNAIWRRRLERQRGLNEDYH